jgi:hypothetical protein
MIRFFPPSEVLTAEESVIIYDYTSFTSSLDEMKAFTRELACFFRGVTVWLVGEKDGLEPMDLGDLLDEYNQACNCDAFFDVSKVLHQEEPSLLQHTCGMLGVPGDIQGKTFLHGIHTAFICASLHKSKCIGDDGRLNTILRTMIDRIVLESRLQNLGKIVLEKTEEFEYDDDDDYELRAWEYAKRPFLRIRNRVLQFEMLTFPTLDCLLGLSDPLRTVLPGSGSIIRRRNRFNQMWVRILTELQYRYMDISEIERQFLFDYQKSAFRGLGIQGRRVGAHKEDDQVYFVPPFVSAETFGEDYTPEVVVRFDYDEEVQVVQEGDSIGIPEGYAGEIFLSKSTQALSFLVKMGVLEKKMVLTTASRALVGDSRFVQLLLGRYRFLYEYTILSPIPNWLPLSSSYI